MFVLSRIAKLTKATTAVGNFFSIPAWERAPTAICVGANIIPPILPDFVLPRIGSQSSATESK